MSTARVEVEVELDEISDRDLLQEVRERGLSTADEFSELAADVLFQCAVMRGDRDEVFWRVSEALRLAPVRNAS
jgi:hypothetical protein